MNEIDHALDRLFRAARRGSEEIATPPFGFSNRVLANWRRRMDQDDSTWVVVLLRRALMIACLVALVSLAVGYRSQQGALPEGLLLADSLISQRLLP